MNYLWGFISAFVLYWQLSYWFPAKETLLSACIYDDGEVIEGVQYPSESDNRVVVGGESSEVSSQSGEEDTSFGGRMDLIDHVYSAEKCLGCPLRITNVQRSRSVSYCPLCLKSIYQATISLSRRSVSARCAPRHPFVRAKPARKCSEALAELPCRKPPSARTHRTQLRMMPMAYPQDHEIVDKHGGQTAIPNGG